MIEIPAFLKLFVSSVKRLYGFSFFLGILSFLLIWQNCYYIFTTREVIQNQSAFTFWFARTKIPKDFDPNGMNHSDARISARKLEEAVLDLPRISSREVRSSFETYQYYISFDFIIAYGGRITYDRHRKIVFDQFLALLIGLKNVQFFTIDHKYAFGIEIQEEYIRKNRCIKRSDNIMKFVWPNGFNNLPYDAMRKRNHCLKNGWFSS